MNKYREATGMPIDTFYRRSPREMMTSTTGIRVFRAVARGGLGEKGGWVYWMVCTAGGPVTTVKIAEEFGNQVQTIEGYADRMTELGLLKRTEDGVMRGGTTLEEAMELLTILTEDGVTDLFYIPDSFFNRTRGCTFTEDWIGETRSFECRRAKYLYCLGIPDA